jgi:hypothetical protein
MEISTGLLSILSEPSSVKNYNKGRSWNHNEIMEAIVATEGLPLHIHNLAEAIIKYQWDRKTIREQLLSVNLPTLWSGQTVLTYAGLTIVQLA